MQLWKGNIYLVYMYYISSHWSLWCSVGFQTDDVHEDHSSVAEAFALVPLKQHFTVILYHPCKLNNTGVFLCHLLWNIFVPAVTPVVLHNSTSKHTEWCCVSWHLLYKPVFTKTRSDNVPWTATSWKDNWPEDYNINYLYSTNITFQFPPVLWMTATTVPCGFF